MVSFKQQHTAQCKAASGAKQQAASSKQQESKTISILRFDVTKQRRRWSYIRRMHIMLWVNNTCYHAIMYFAYTNVHEMMLLKDASTPGQNPYIHTVLTQTNYEMCILRMYVIAVSPHNDTLFLQRVFCCSIKRFWMYSKALRTSLEISMGIGFSSSITISSGLCLAKLQQRSTISTYGTTLSSGGFIDCAWYHWCTLLGRIVNNVWTASGGSLLIIDSSFLRFSSDVFSLTIFLTDLYVSL